MFTLSSHITRRLMKTNEALPCTMVPLFKHFQDDAKRNFVSLQGMALQFERFQCTGKFMCFEQQECHALTDEFRRAGFEIEFCEREVLNSNSMCMEKCGYVKIVNAHYDDKQAVGSAQIKSAHEWFQAMERFATDWLSHEVGEKLGKFTFADALVVYLPEVPTYQTDNQAWFRFRIFEHAIKWISATTCFDATFSVTRNVHKITLTLKTTNCTLQMAKLRSEALLISAAVILPRATIPYPNQPDWSRLPHTALDLVVRFLVGSKAPQMCFEVTGAGTEQVNGKYLFSHIVDPTSDNYRNLVFEKQRGGGGDMEEEDEKLFLIRIAQGNCGPCGKELRWCISTAEDSSKPHREFYISKSSHFQSFPEQDGWEESEHGAAPAPKVKVCL